MPSFAPTLGQHIEQVLSEVLGLDHAALDALAATGALGAIKRATVAGN